MKKGVSAYVGWVLLTAFMVVLSTLVYSWMTAHVETQTDKIKQRSDENACEFTSLSIKGFCQDDYHLTFNATNTKDNRIIALKVQLFDIYDNPYETQLNITLKPSQTNEFKIFKHGTLAQADIIPVIVDDIRCDSSKAVLTPIEMC